MVTNKQATNTKAQYKKIMNKPFPSSCMNEWRKGKKAVATLLQNQRGESRKSHAWHNTYWWVKKDSLPTETLGLSIQSNDE
jgi:hypothetical protein